MIASSRSRCWSCRRGYPRRLLHERSSCMQWSGEAGVGVAGAGDGGEECAAAVYLVAGHADIIGACAP